MIQIPKIPPPEELQYKEKEFFLSVYEQWQASSRILFLILLVVAVVSIPAWIFLEKYLAERLILENKVLPVNVEPYKPQNLKVFKADVLPVTAGTFSAYAQIINPNADISARNFEYEFIVKDKSGKIIQTMPENSYLPAGESKFLLLPTLALGSPPGSVEIALGRINWTKLKPEFDVHLEVLQAGKGTTNEGNFFVEGSVRAAQGFRLKKVDVAVVIFDEKNQNVLAVNSTLLTDLNAFESRYFRVIWPVDRGEASLGNLPLGQIQVTAKVNPLDPGAYLEESDKIPAR